jgi:hypothetical protein
MCKEVLYSSEEDSNSGEMEINSDDDTTDNETISYITLPCGKRFYNRFSMMETFMGRAPTEVSDYFFFFFFH